ncbi:MAG: TlpA family protein disulfide reductase [Bacteroidetes bacterium]|nr:TlpA family protein disulfide reductase [Bacteroidota bacterium]
MRTTVNTLALGALALLMGCATGDAHRTITAHVEGGAGRTLYFDTFIGNKPQRVDSVVLDAQGDGVLRIARMPLDFYALALGDKDMLVLVLDSAESVTVEAAAAGFQEPKKVEGSVHSDLLYGFFAEAKRFDAEKQQLVDRINADRADTAAITRINAINREFYAYCKQFAAEHKSSPAVLAAMSRLNIQQELPLFIEVREALRGTVPYSEYYAGYRDQVDRMEQQVAAMKAQEEQMARLDNLIPVGSEAPDFAQQTPEGRKLALSDLKGQVVLIDFWASWCKPCRMENPNVKRVYTKYHAKGFEILGVSLDRDQAAWTNAIQQDGLPWKHVSDLGFWNNAAAQQYGVSSIPYTVLVGRDGKVIAKNLRGEKLEQKLAEIFP